MRQLVRSGIRSCAVNRFALWWPVIRPAVTTAMTPEACSSSAGMNARNGTTSEIAVMSTG